MDLTNDSSRVKELEKRVRTLAKKLARSEADRQGLECANELRESVLKNVIRELEDAKTILENRSHALEATLSDLKGLQLKLVESEKMSALGVLVAGVAHEINNPINFIHGNLEYAQAYLQELFELVHLYQDYYPEPIEAIQTKLAGMNLSFLESDSEKLFHSMKIGSDRIAEIVLSLRNFSRLDEAECKPVDLHEGIDNTLMILQHRLKANAERPEIVITKQYGEIPLVSCCAGKLNQVFMNLLANAIDALEERNQGRSFKSIVAAPNRIWIHTVRLNPNWVQITIADNGLGIPEDVRSRLFDPFFTTKPVGKGTGLGLSISYQVVTEGHGGRLWCDSKRGVGSKFVIEIPIRGDMAMARVKQDRCELASHHSSEH
jgi:two-component system, NtrC family, sensor kinase